jgi:uncharacterized membrane protein YtjA (UPF0391 family)
LETPPRLHLAAAVVRNTESITDWQFATWPPIIFQGELEMLRLAILFLVIALIAAFFGFAGVASLSWAGAKMLFVIFLILAVLSFLAHGFRRRTFLG